MVFKFNGIRLKFHKVVSQSLLLLCLYLLSVPRVSKLLGTLKGNVLTVIISPLFRYSRVFSRLVKSSLSVGALIKTGGGKVVSIQGLSQD